MSSRIAILDYGMGNLRSVEKAFEKVGADCLRTRVSDQILAAAGLVLPGVGAFPRAMARIRELGWDRLITDRVQAGVPVLGICLGYQLLFERSSEFGGDRGLDLIEGEVTELEATGLKLPHIGWEPVRWQRKSPLIDGLGGETAFYFVHSLAPRPAGEDCLGTAVYGSGFAAAAQSGNVFGVQFHPEKSSEAGLRLLANFTAICDS